MHFEKTAWTDENFEEMGWHDCKIYAMSFNSERFELIFDIDYILQSVDPEKDNANYSFWISPATLIFGNVYDINMNIYSTDLEILDISKGNSAIPKNVNHIDTLIEYDWTIETSTGEITFKSIGYRQVMRKPPKLYDRQSIGLLERGGVSFEEVFKDS